jgi:hypothetical protein
VTSSEGCRSPASPVAQTALSHDPTHQANALQAAARHLKSSSTLPAPPTTEATTSGRRATPQRQRRPPKPPSPSELHASVPGAHREPVLFRTSARRAALASGPFNAARSEVGGQVPVPVPGRNGGCGTVRGSFSAGQGSCLAGGCYDGSALRWRRAAPADAAVTGVLCPALPGRRAPSVCLASGRPERDCPVPAQPSIMGLQTGFRSDTSRGPSRSTLQTVTSPGRISRSAFSARGSRASGSPGP